ncbi:hypothetical protein [Sphingobium fuliginis]|jgi:hypothetical protein|uniref:hypothetical protein n=1 Tax=Sphingobium fuliginis (strain ATCC 27551) TaxID=336203 RepID=UPI0037CA85B7
MNVTIDWWAIPALITIGSLIWAFWPQRTTGYGADIVGVVQFLASIIVSLAAWLVWSLLA